MQEQQGTTESRDSADRLNLTFYCGITVGVAPHPHGNPVRCDPVPAVLLWMWSPLLQLPAVTTVFSLSPLLSRPLFTSVASWHWRAQCPVNCILLENCLPEKWGRKFPFCMNVGAKLKFWAPKTRHWLQLIPVQQIWFTEVTEYWRNFQRSIAKGNDGALTLKGFEKQETQTKGMRVADQSTRVLKRTWPLWMNW